MRLDGSNCEGTGGRFYGSDIKKKCILWHYSIAGYLKGENYPLCYQSEKPQNIAAMGFYLRVCNEICPTQPNQPSYPSFSDTDWWLQLTREKTATPGFLLGFLLIPNPSASPSPSVRSEYLKGYIWDGLIETLLRGSSSFGTKMLAHLKLMSKQRVHGCSSLMGARQYTSVFSQICSWVNAVKCSMVQCSAV